MEDHLTLEDVEGESTFSCLLCSARFTQVSSRQIHMFESHRFRNEGERINLLQHLTPLSEERECNGEWEFAESRLIEAGESDLCPCGRTRARQYFILENKLNGNRTFVGSSCIKIIDQRLGDVIAYFYYIINYPIKGRFIKTTEKGLQQFVVKPYTKLAMGAETTVKHLNPPVSNTLYKTAVLVKYSKPETLVHGEVYKLKLKAKYRQGELTFTAI